MFAPVSIEGVDERVMIASGVIKVLKQYGVMPGNKLGQNFLCDANVARWIVEQLDLQPEGAEWGGRAVIKDFDGHTVELT